MAPFPIVDPTTGAAGAVDPNWSVLPGSSAEAATYTSDGWLRLTNAANNHRAALLFPTAFPSTTGFIVEFDYRQTGGIAAPRTGDGISFFLVDGAAPPASPGAYGGGLSYARSTGVLPRCGIQNGYLGLGLDAYGNFASSVQGNTGGLSAGSVGNSLVLRGSSNSANCNPATGVTTGPVFPFISGVTNPGGFSVETGGVPPLTDPVNGVLAGYRRVRIVVLPSGGTVQATVSMSPITAKPSQPSAMTQVLQSTVSGPSQAALPATLMIGVGASTGGATNYQDIREVLVTALSDLKITKALDASTPGPFRHGDPIKFNLDAVNLGPTGIGTGPGTSARVYDNFAGQPLTNVTWTCTANAGSACVSAGGVGSPVDVGWYDTGAVPGGGVRITVTANINSPGPGGNSATNTAYIPTFSKSGGVYTSDNSVLAANSVVQSDGGVGDLDLSNNTASANYVVLGVAPAVDTGTATAGTASTAIPNVRANDVADGIAATGGNSTLTVITPASNPGVVLNTATGAVTVSTTVPPGTYTIVYQLCDLAAPPICNNASVTVTVSPKVDDGTVSVPTLSEWSLLVLTGLLSATAFIPGVRRRRK